MKPSVRFGDNHSTHYYDAPADPESFWLSEEELDQVERNAKEAGREAMRNGLALLMESTFAKPDGEAQKNLNLFVRIGDARGVERVICQSHFNERKEQKAEVFQSVLETQNTATKFDWHNSKRSEKLREVSMEHSYKSKLFARKMAIADEAACYPVLKKKSGRTGSALVHKPVGLVRRQSRENARCSLAIFGCF